MAAGPDWWAYPHVSQWRLCGGPGGHGHHWIRGKPPGSPTEADRPEDGKDKASLPSVLHHRLVGYGYSVSTF